MTIDSLQVANEPIQSIQALDQFVSEQRQHRAWDLAAILSTPEIVLILLLTKQKDIIQVLRICFDNESNTLVALKELNKNKNKIECGEVDKLDSLSDLSSLKTVFELSTLNSKTLKQAYSSCFNHKAGGRGRPISASTAREVVFESYGYCMFDGCGANLHIDSLTGVKGNFTYLAHIVASSPDGPRGNCRSHELSNDVSNIMVLCDKHHRLIDKVSVDEYPAQRLLKMKASFKEAAAFFLQGLMYLEVPTYTAFWPIGGTSPEDPSLQEYSVSLHPINCRPSGVARHLINLRPNVIQDDNWWAESAVCELKGIGSDFKSYSESYRHKAGIYALGPSSIMVGLGAVLGNKNSLCVVPRSRANGWGWSRDNPLEKPFSSDYDRHSLGTTKEVAVTLFLTASPSESDCLLEYFRVSGMPVVTITASEPGNESLAHFKESSYLREMLVNLFHDLRNNHGVSLIHLVHCASNAACIEAGRAIEHNHPSFRIYEHCKSQSRKYFVPRLNIITGNDCVDIQSTDLSEVAKFHDLFGNR